MFVDYSKSLTDEMDSFDGAAEIARIRSGRVLDKAGKPKAKRGSPERDFQRTALKWLRLVLPSGSMVAASVNEQRGDGTKEQRMRYGAARKASGVVTGWPDLTIAVAGGPVVFAELKAEKGRLSEDQREVHSALHRAGHCVVVARSLDDLRAGLRAAGVQTRDAAA